MYIYVNIYKYIYSYDKKTYMDMKKYEYETGFHGSAVFECFFRNVFFIAPSQKQIKTVFSESWK